MNKLFLIFLLMTFLVFEGQTQTRMVRVQNTLRQFTLYQSSKINDGDTAPLILSFHGWGMTALEHMMYTQTNEVIEENGAIIVYPQGVNNDWNVGFEQDYDGGTNDVEFIAILLEKLIENYPIDTSRVYVIGLSRGGFFAQRLVAELPGQIKGFVTIGAPMSTKVKDRMMSNDTIIAMYVHGTSDEIVNMDGVEGEYLSVAECISYWKSRNQEVNKTFTRFCKGGNNEASANLIYYGTVAQITIEKGGHTWPDTDPFNVGFPLGKTIQGIGFNQLWFDFLVK